MSAVPGHRVANVTAALNPGDFWLTPPNPAEGGARRLSFICPCGCGAVGGIRVRNDGAHRDGAWGWDRNESQPTATPSILFDGHWHGHLVKGVFIPC